MREEVVPALQTKLEEVEAASTKYKCQLQELQTEKLLRENELHQEKLDLLSLNAKAGDKITELQQSLRNKQEENDRVIDDHNAHQASDHDIQALLGNHSWMKIPGSAEDEKGDQGDGGGRNVHRGRMEQKSMDGRRNDDGDSFQASHYQHKSHKSAYDREAEVVELRKVKVALAKQLRACQDELNVCRFDLQVGSQSLESYRCDVYTSIVRVSTITPNKYTHSDVL